MEKFIVVANFANECLCEDDLYTSQWLVGTFDTVAECTEAALEDLIDTACDHYECAIPEEDFYNEEGELNQEEFDKAVQDKAKTYLDNRWEPTLDDIINSLVTSNSVEIMSNDFLDDEFTDQRQVIKYYVYRIIL